MITQNNSLYQNTIDESIILKDTSRLFSKLSELHGKLENDLTLEDIESLNPEKRGYPKYLTGTFNSDGIPNNPVMAQAYDNIVLGLAVLT